MIDLVIATRNGGKLREIRAMASHIELNLLSLDDFKQIGQIKESGKTFEENAVLKARTVAKKTGILTLADDSGLEVEHLNDQPGIYSARFAGEKASDYANNEKLLELLRDVPPHHRYARFVCTIALATPETLIGTVTGTCEGMIGDKLTGSGGFGYDPLFIVNNYNQTFAELRPEIKNKISHRAKAIGKALIMLENYLIEKQNT